MNGVSETSSTLCNNGYENAKNSLDNNNNNKNYSLLKYHQITTAQNELISIQRSLIRELLKYSKEFQERFNNNFNANDNNNQEQQQTGKGMEYDTMQTDVESIRDEISFVKSIKDVVKGDNGNGTVTKNKRKTSITKQNKDTGFLFSENSSQNNHLSQNQENDNIVDTAHSSTNFNDFSSVNEFPRDTSDFVASEQNYEDSQTTSTPFPTNSDYLRNYNEPNETNESNEDCFGEYKGFNSIYIGGINETIDVQLLRQCLEETLGPVRFIRIIRNKSCAFAEFEEKSCFTAALKLGLVCLNGVNLKINKTFRKQKKFENFSDERQN